MTAKPTTTTYAVLGLLSVRSWTTYELAKQVQRSLSWFWPRAERKLYDEPKRLVEQGLATATSELTGRRPRTVYAINAEGRRALRSWLGEPAAPPSREDEAMVKVFFADGGSKRQLLATLDRMEAETRGRLEALTAMVEDPSAFPSRAHLNALTIRLQADLETASLQWVAWAREQVEQWRSAADPGGWDPDAALATLANRSATGG